MKQSLNTQKTKEIKNKVLKKRYWDFKISPQNKKSKKILWNIGGESLKLYYIFFRKDTIQKLCGTKERERGKGIMFQEQQWETKYKSTTTFLMKGGEGEGGKRSEMKCEW